MRLHRNGGRWPCWILLGILPRAIALNERCSMVDIVLKQAHIPPRSSIRVRDQKCWHRRRRWQRTACHPCEPQVASMSIGSVCMLIGLVSSSAMSYSNRLFTESDALTWSLFPISPLTCGVMTDVQYVYKRLVTREYKASIKLFPVPGNTILFGCV